MTYLYALQNITTACNAINHQIYCDCLLMSVLQHPVDYLLHSFALSSRACGILSTKRLYIYTFILYYTTTDKQRSTWYIRYKRSMFFFTTTLYAQSFIIGSDSYVRYIVCNCVVYCKNIAPYYTSASWSNLYK